LLASEHEPALGLVSNPHDSHTAPGFCSTEDYTEDLALAHVRRLLGIVARITSFGSSGKHEPGKGVAHGASSPAGIMAEVTGNLPTTTGEDSESEERSCCSGQ
jgi:hypothetical protein